MPLDIIHIIIRLLKRINRGYQMIRRRRFRQTLRSPQLDRPIHRTRQKQIRKIYRPHQRMEVKSHDGTRMAFIYVVLVKTSFCSSTVVSVGLIYVALLSTHPKGRGFVVREIERRDRNFTGFVVSRMNKLKCFLYILRKCQEKMEGESITCGCASMSTNQLHTVPSVLLVIRLCAFCVPTMCMAYTGCVCPAADSGVFNTGRCFARVSHNNI